MSTASTWMPRAATSVATTALALPEEKRWRLRSRTFWLRLPCRSTASTPWWVRASASSTAPSRVRVKMIVRPLASTRRTAVPTFSRKPPTVSVWWVIVVTEPALGSSSWSFGLRRWVRTSLSTSPSSVALSSIRCEPSGVIPTSLSTDG